MSRHHHEFRYAGIEKVSKAAELAREFVVSQYPQMQLVPMHWWQNSFGAYETYVDARGFDITDKQLCEIAELYAHKAYEILKSL